MRAWYFAAEDRKLRYRDNRPIIVGETHSVDLSKRDLELCAYGLHASVRPIDALQYAPSAVLYEVELSGEIIEGTDKVVAEHRKYIREIDATDILKELARKQALINIEKIKPYCSNEDYSLIIEWLNTGNEELRSEAEEAAWSAESAAWSAEAAESARSAWSAESAAWSAWSARSAAWSAARSAESAARSATRSAAEAVAWSAARSAARSVARSAAWSAARSAARSAANDMLLAMVEEK